MERWLTIDEYMDTLFGLFTTISSIGSLIFVGLGYCLAKDYLKQHREKVKEGEKIRIIYDTKLKLREYWVLLDELYSFPYSLTKELEDNPSKFDKLIDDYMSDQNQKLEQKKNVRRLKIEIISNLNLLRLNELSKTALEMFQNFEHLELFHQVYRNKKEISNYPPIDYKLFQVLSTNIESKNPFIEKGNLIFKKIQEELTEKYWGG